MDLYERIMELGSMGYHCSQIIMIMTLETIGEENPQLVPGYRFSSQQTDSAAKSNAHSTAALCS